MASVDEKGRKYTPTKKAYKNESFINSSQARARGRDDAEETGLCNSSLVCYMLVICLTWAWLVGYLMHKCPCSLSTQRTFHQASGLIRCVYDESPVLPVWITVQFERGTTMIFSASVRSLNGHCVTNQIVLRFIVFSVHPICCTSSRVSGIMYRRGTSASCASTKRLCSD